MKIHFGKSFIAILALLFFFGGKADAQKKLCLQDIKTNVEGDFIHYGYNKEGLIDSIYSYTAYYDDAVYRLFKYDEKGNMVAVEGYCVLPVNDNDYNEFTKTYKIIYGFDENNRLISRENYNLDTWEGTGEFLLGGVYEYIYDEKGLLKERKLYWDEGKTDLFETAQYTYDENDRIKEETYLHHGFGSPSKDMVLNYFYDEEGRLIRLRNDALNYTTGKLEESENLIYEYDGNNNLVRRTSYATDPERPNEDHRFTFYTDTLAADVAMPINYEDDMDFYTRSKNVVMKDSVYIRDMETDNFGFYDVQDWEYAEVGAASGIENVIGGNDMLCVSRDNQGDILLNGIENHENVRVYDSNGRMIRNGAYNGKVRVSNLPAGMYILVTRQGCVKITR